MDDHRDVTGAVDTEPPSASPPGSRRRLRRFGVLAVAASFVVIWGYVMYLSFVEGRSDPRDELDDTEWVATAEATCAPTAAAVDRLPLASELDSPDERAAVLDSATDELVGMVDRLRALEPPAGEAEARAVDRWLDDWDTYIQDRRAYADGFRADVDEPFTVTDRGGYQVDLLLHDFAAEANEMPSCAPPEDVG